MSYRAFSRLVMVLSCGLAALVVVAVALIVRRGLFILKALSGPMPPGSIAFAAWIDAAIGRIALALVIGTMVVTVFRAVWAMQSNRIIRKRTTFKLFFSPAPVFWWHFMPLANLFVPFSILDELMRASTGRLDWATQPMPGAVKANWCFFGLQMIGLVILNYLPEGDHSIHHLMATNGILLATLLSAFGKCLTFANMVEVVDARIEDLADMSPLPGQP